MDGHPFFLDEAYGGFSLFLSGISKKHLQKVPTKIMAEEKESGTVRRRSVKRTDVDSKTDSGTSSSVKLKRVVQNGRTSRWNIILLNGTTIDVVKTAQVIWNDFFCKYLALASITGVLRRKPGRQELQQHDRDVHASSTVRLRRSSSDQKWTDWLYEKEQMIPEPVERETDTKALSERERVAPRDLEEYLGIEPRMRCHYHADSLFSTSSGFTNYRGVLNWLIVISLCSMGRTALENVIKYGILIRPLEVLHPILENPHEWRCLRLVLLTNVYIMMIFWLERMMSKNQLSQRLGLALETLTLLSVVIVPGTIVYITHPHPVFSSITLGTQAITFLKLVSYVQVNKWCREQTIHVDRRARRKRIQSTSSSADLLNANNHVEGLKGISRELVSYPDNLTLKDLYYFIFTPTLCYELNFPRSERIRKRFLTKRIIEMLFLSGLMMGLIQQWIVPLVHNSRVPFKELDIGKMLERLLKLAVPNHLIWLIFFYWAFHSSLNTIAEILCFGDRIFYRDWWNAANIREFWQNWNIPVHRWAIRHLYKPLVATGYSPGLASIAVFLVSAFFHEYLLSVPLKMFRLWAFSAMVMQVPLAYMTRYMDQKMGNIVVWLSLIIGQPAAVLMYYHDYYVTHLEGLSGDT